MGHYKADYLPTARGFDYSVGYMDSHNYYWSKLNLDYSNDTDFMQADKDCYNIYNNTDSGNYSTYFYTNKAVKAIESHDFDANPMFLYFASQAVHDPFTDLAEYQSGIPDYYVGECVCVCADLCVSLCQFVWLCFCDCVVLLNY